MIDREKVIKELEERIKVAEECMGNPIFTPDAMRIIVALLKEQEDTINELQNAYGYLQKQFFEAQDKMLKEQEWIPVTERLPKYMANKVLVYLQHEYWVDQIGYGHYERYQGVEMWYDIESGKQFSNMGYTVTHWMPLPKSPKGERLALS